MHKKQSITYAAATFAGSFLLFLIQPMIAKAVTPVFGGTASVWNSALLVGQVLLLMGSVYAYRLLGPQYGKGARKIHLAMTFVILLIAAALPEYVLQRPLPSFATEYSPEVGVPFLMVATIGPIMLLLGAQGPILQRSLSAATGNKNPYPLYAASNAGSLSGLLAYPLVLEPLTSTTDQIIAWEIFAGLVLLMNALLVFFRPIKAESSKKTQEEKTTAKTLISWSLPAFCATIIMMSAGQAITTDIMAMPLLWILPLGAFLIGYMTAFSSDEGSSFKKNLKIPQAGLVLLAAGTASPLVISNPIIGMLGIASIGLVTHGLMRGVYERRPEADRLGTFYLCLALGGAAGGFLVAIASPMIFSWRWELPFAIIMAAFLFDPTSPSNKPIQKTGERILQILAIIGGGFAIFLQTLKLETEGQIAGILLICIGIAIQSTSSRRKFALWVTWLMLCVGLVSLIIRANEGELRRSYYGIMAVQHEQYNGEPATLLTHGSTIHGLQINSDPTRTTSYYTPESGVGDAMQSLSASNKKDIAIAGLGTGTIACLAPAKSNLTFYEVDPEIVKAARGDFTFLERCAPQADIVLGDARVSISKREQKYDAIILDAFTSDAIPMHLMTEEALDIYDAQLKDDGWLIIHVSNRYLKVSHPVAAWATQRGYAAMILDNEEPGDNKSTRSQWVGIRPDGWKEEEKGWTADPRWIRATGSKSWTDEKSSIIDIIKSL